MYRFADKVRDGWVDRGLKMKKFSQEEQREIYKVALLVDVDADRYLALMMTI